MERKSASTPIYEKFEPSIEWAREPTSDTLVVPLPGFRKEQLKVQVSVSNKLRISGERDLGNNKGSSFRMELQIPSNYDANGISAKFEGGKLLIKHPKIITPASYDQQVDGEKPQAQTKAPKPESYHSQAQKRVQATQQLNPPSPGINGPEKSGKNYPPNTSVEKQASCKANNGEAKAAAAQNGEDLAEEGKCTSGANAKMEKDEKVDEAAASAEVSKESAGSSNSNDQRDITKFGTEDLKQALGGLVMELKQRKKLMNVTVAVLLVLVAYIYAKSAIGYIGKSKI